MMQIKGRRETVTEGGKRSSCGDLIRFAEGGSLTVRSATLLEGGNGRRSS